MWKKLKGSVQMRILDPAHILANEMLMTLEKKRMHKKGLAGKVVGLLVVVLLLGALGPTIFQQFVGLSNTENLSTGTAAILATFGVIVAVALLIGIMKFMGINVGLK